MNRRMSEKVLRLLHYEKQTGWALHNKQSFSLSIFSVISYVNISSVWSHLLKKSSTKNFFFCAV